MSDIIWCVKRGCLESDLIHLGHPLKCAILIKFCFKVVSYSHPHKIHPFGRSTMIRTRVFIPKAGFFKLVFLLMLQRVAYLQRCLFESETQGCKEWWFWCRKSLIEAVSSCFLIFYPTVGSKYQITCLCDATQGCISVWNLFERETKGCKKRWFILTKGFRAKNALAKAVKGTTCGRISERAHFSFAA